MVLAAAGAALALWRAGGGAGHSQDSSDGPALLPDERGTRPHGLVVRQGGSAFRREHYLVQALNAYGRYSNARIAFVDHAVLAHYTNRTLLYAPFHNCEAGETIDDLLDTSGWAGIVQLRALATVQLNLTCGRTSAPPVMFVRADWAGFQLFDSPEWLAGALPASSKPGDVWLHGNVSWTLRGMCLIFDDATPVVSSCIGVHNIWRLEMRYLEHTHAVLQRRLRPAPAVQAEVRRFLEAHSLSRQHNATSHPDAGAPGEGPPAAPVLFVGAHLRLTDIGGGTGRTGLPCRVNMTLFSEAVHLAMEQVGTATVLLASDDLQAPCALAFIAEFRPVIVASGVWRPSSCREAAFSQEVLALSAGFVGSNVNSTFSETVEVIRRHRVRQPGALPGFALPPFDDTFFKPKNSSGAHPGFLEACA